jgi:hypothetical protein
MEQGLANKRGVMRGQIYRYGLIITLAVMSIAGLAQEPPVNMHMRARWVSSVPCADVW